ncbi:16S rRNA (cytidine(1402)-2'-O)-methyltransferase [Candidatus Sulfidibacterium hydrothermale]|uniref:16S rRNA (cytidine(1402)-2'-O)-methyltransferase n=1 Tax=Candidatus Sulfidibacterium hydrothermale TaxID=2875962 RepID=UPI001F0AEE90|nr:16S rRNA (cytidine(1402)-2'-O)-methyltransferase [Candidatus Sulfidibacterium hydrothermale]UBM62765.1 16S rRNA (cytidine(1402)-2'-O)-methyltransferase [Candidatus Sulfidibacterium hydrothermale]
MSKLYLVPTPIGNLEDITFRALRILKEVSLILAEDTRTTGTLLKHYDIQNRLQSFHIHNEHKVVARYVEQILAGETIALVSDAGTPSISDPGFLLVRECLKNNIPVETLPGATAFVPALVNSGFPSDRFFFEGFLPHKKGRQTRLKELAQYPHTLILYESPYRLIKTLEQMMTVFDPERPVSVSRELTKIHEETIRGTFAEVLEYFKNKPVKGEIVIVVGHKGDL